MTNIATDEMIQGYRDGGDLDNPEPSANRSHSYRHGFKVGRGDRTGEGAGHADVLRRGADMAIKKDAAA